MHFAMCGSLQRVQLLCSAPSSLALRCIAQAAWVIGKCAEAGMRTYAACPGPAACACSRASAGVSRVVHQLTQTAGRGVQLKLLACHISGGEQSGTVYANGLPIVEAEFKNQLAVVWQSDVLLSTATVRCVVASVHR